MTGTYLAMDVSLESVERIVLAQEDLEPVLASRGAKVRWNTAPQMHVCLKAMPGVGEPLVYGVCETLEELTGSLVPFKVSVKGLTAWPRPETPRLLMAKLDLGSDLVASFHKVIESKLEAMGLTKDPRPFEPAILVGRVMTPEGKVDLGDAMAEAAELDFGESYVKSVMLLRPAVTGPNKDLRVFRRFALGR